MQKIFFLLLFTSYLVANELQWVDEQINSIIPPRNGIVTKNLNDLENPFVTLVNKKKKDRTKTTYIKHYTSTTRSHLYLDAIMNNSALINGSWYKIGSYIKGYRVKIITTNLVILKKANKTLKLTTQSKNSPLKISK
jgi:hypothetical protein